MRKFIIPALLLAVILGACQGQAPAEIAATSTAPAVSSATQSPSQALPSTPASQPPVGCTVVSPQPTPGPTEQSLFPPVSDQDWSQGAKTASVTILEYSDFQ